MFVISKFGPFRDVLHLRFQVLSLVRTSTSTWLLLKMWIRDVKLSRFGDHREHYYVANIRRFRVSCPTQTQLNQQGMKEWHRNITKSTKSPHIRWGTSATGEHWFSSQSRWIRTQYSSPRRRIYVSLVQEHGRSRVQIRDFAKQPVQTETQATLNNKFIANTFTVMCVWHEHRQSLHTALDIVSNTCCILINCHHLKHFISFILLAWGCHVLVGNLAMILNLRQKWASWTYTSNNSYYGCISSYTTNDLVGAATEKLWIRYRIVQIGALQIGLHALRWLISHFDTILKDWYREVRTRVTCQP